jgi:hypothetical protein
LKVGYASSPAHDNKTSRSGLGFHHNLKLKHGLKRCAPRVFITPTVSSKLSRRPLGLKVGYASSRAHNNNTSRSGFHNSHGVFKSFAQAARIEGGLCEFERAQQQDHSLGFGFSS